MFHKYPVVCTQCKDSPMGYWRCVLAVPVFRAALIHSCGISCHIMPLQLQPESCVQQQMAISCMYAMAGWQVAQKDSD